MRIDSRLRKALEEIPYYRDKYLGMVFGLALVLAVDSVWPRPVSRNQLLTASVWSGVALASVLASPRRILVMAVGLGMLSLRAGVGFLFTGSVESLLFGVVTSVGLFLTLRRSAKQADDFRTHQSTVPELAVDSAVLIGVIYLVIKAT